MLIQDDELISYLGTDPRKLTAAVYVAAKSRTPPVYDQITMRESGVDNDPRFRPFVVDRVFIDFEAWTDQEDADRLERVRKVLDRLFNRKRFALPDPTNNYLDRMERIPGASPMNYNATIKAWYGMWRYQARVRESDPTSILV